MQFLVPGLILIAIAIAIMIAAKLRINANVKGAHAVGPLLIGIALLIGSMVTVIPAGHVGVKVLFGRVQADALEEGLHLINPLVDVVEMSIRLENYTMSMTKNEGRRSSNDSIMVLSKDGLQMALDITVAYRLLPSDAPEIYRMLGENYDEKIIRPAARTAIRTASSQFTAQEAYASKREELGSITQSTLEKSIVKLLSQEGDKEISGIVVQSVMLRNVTLPDRLRKAIEEKLSAEQESQRMEFVITKERQEAERKKIEASGIKEFQDIVSSGISPELLRWKGIEATLKIAESNNSKVIVIGSGKDGLPVILNAEQ